MTQHRSCGLRTTLLRLLASVSLVLVTASAVHADLYIRDDLGDTGAEPTRPPRPCGLLARHLGAHGAASPAGIHAPYPIASPPPWMVPGPAHQDPDYRSPLSGKPNYVYIRVRNRTGTSAGTERLQLYWSAASTGLTWDPAKVAGSFIDNVKRGQRAVRSGDHEAPPERGNRQPGGARRLRRRHHQDRRHRRSRHVVFPNGGDTFWHTQQEIHRFGPTFRHGGPVIYIRSSLRFAFLPWHREYINRYEGLLQEPTRTSSSSTGSGHKIRARDPRLTNDHGRLGGNQERRASHGGPVPRRQRWLCLSARVAQLRPHRKLRSGAPTRSRTPPSVVKGLMIRRRGKHDFRAESKASAGTARTSTSRNDRPPAPAPQRYRANAPTAGTSSRQPLRRAIRSSSCCMPRWTSVGPLAAEALDNSTRHDLRHAAGNVTNTSTMGPWNGYTVPNDGLPNVWPAPSRAMDRERRPGLRQAGKRPLRHLGAVYDTAPLTIPVLQTGEEVVVDIPWYPPNPASRQPQRSTHVCLIARIETSATMPFGRTVGDARHQLQHTPEQRHRVEERIGGRHVPGRVSQDRAQLVNHFGESVKPGLRIGALLTGEAPSSSRAVS